MLKLDLLISSYFQETNPIIELPLGKEKKNKSHHRIAFISAIGQLTELAPPNIEVNFPYVTTATMNKLYDLIL